MQCSDLNGVEGGEWPNCTCEQGYEFNSTTNSCEAVTPEPAPDEISCGVSNLYLWASGFYDTATGACANYLNDGISRRIATLEEAQCLCGANQLAKQTYWTSTEYKDDFTGEKDGTYWTIQGSSCRLNSKVPTTALAAVCVTD